MTIGDKPREQLRSAPMADYPILFMGPLAQDNRSPVQPRGVANDPAMTRQTYGETQVLHYHREVRTMGRSHGPRGALGPGRPGHKPWS